MEKVSSRACPLCGSHRGKILAGIKNITPATTPLDGAFDLLTCAECGFAFSDLIATSADHAAHYSAGHSNCHVPRYAFGSGVRGFDAGNKAKQAEIITARCKNKNISIADIGCATGGLLCALRDMGFTDLTGYDASQASIDVVKERGFNGHRLLLGEHFEGMPIHDVVILSHILEHLQEPAAALHHIRHLLADDAILYVEVPDLSVSYMNWASIGYEFCVEHINFFSPATLHNMLEATGFSLVESGQYTFRIESGNSTATYAFARKKDIPESITFAEDENLIQGLKRSVENERILMHGILYALDRLACDGKIILWGAGLLLQRLMGYEGFDPAKVACLVDVHPPLHNTTMAGIPIISPNDLASSRKYENLPIVIASNRVEGSIISMARELGLQNEIYSLSGAQIFSGAF